MSVREPENPLETWSITQWLYKGKGILEVGFHIRSIVGGIIVALKTITSFYSIS